MRPIDRCHGSKIVKIIQESDHGFGYRRLTVGSRNNRVSSLDGNEEKKWMAPHFSHSQLHVIAKLQIPMHA